MWKWVLLVLLLLIGGVLVMAAMQPDTYTVTRKAVVPASPQVAFAQVNDFRRWDAWSPWGKLDPNMETTFGGAARGPGATYAWKGNSDVGEGDMTIIESKEPEHVAIDLHFVKPFEDRSKTDFYFSPSGEGTEVTWTMAGNHNFISKLMCVFLDMDTLIGGDFEKGLNAMKETVKTLPPPAAPSPAEAPAVPAPATR